MEAQRKENEWGRLEKGEHVLTIETWGQTEIVACRLLHLGS